MRVSHLEGVVVGDGEVEQVIGIKVGFEGHAGGRQGGHGAVGGRGLEEREQQVLHQVQRTAGVVLFPTEGGEGGGKGFQICI